MSIEGIWTGEAYGMFGWESRGVFMLEKGRVVGGDHRQFSTGTYSLTGDRVTAELNVYYYGPPRTAFGEKSEQFKIALEGTLADGVITGSATRPGIEQFSLQYRFTRRMDLPAL